MLIEDIAPGEKLPTQVKLAEEMGVSRYSVREDLKVQEATGLIDKPPSGRYQVPSSLPCNKLGALSGTLREGLQLAWEALEVARSLIVEMTRLAAKAKRRKAISPTCEKSSSCGRGKGTIGILCSRLSKNVYMEFLWCLAIATRNSVYQHLIRSFTEMMDKSCPDPHILLRRMPESREMSITICTGHGLPWGKRNPA
jgi:DNA-binding FadR family transcriptional regulator